MKGKSYTKEYRKEASRKYYLKHKEKLIKASHDYYHSLTEEERKARNKKNYDKKRKKLLQESEVYKEIKDEERIEDKEQFVKNLKKQTSKDKRRHNLLTKKEKERRAYAIFKNKIYTVDKKEDDLSIKYIK